MEDIWCYFSCTIEDHTAKTSMSQDLAEFRSEMKKLNQKRTEAKLGGGGKNCKEHSATVLVSVMECMPPNVINSAYFVRALLNLFCSQAGQQP